MFTLERKGFLRGIMGIISTGDNPTITIGKQEVKHWP